MANANDNTSVCVNLRQTAEGGCVRTNEMPMTRTHQDLSIYQLSNLPPPEPKFSLEELFKSDDSRSDNRFEPGFESIECCRAEDKRRAHALRHFPGLEDLEAKYPGLDLIELEAWLENPSEGWPGELSRAFATSMREIRLRFLGATLKFISDHSELKPAWITASHPDWSFGIKDAFWDQWHYPAPRMFRSILRIGGVMTAPGYLIAYLHAQFEPTEKRFFIQFRGICAGQKLGHFRRLRAALAEPRNLPLIRDYLGLWVDASRITVGVHEIVNLQRQILQMMPNSATERTKRGHQPLTTRRVKEPDHSVYVLWARIYEHQPLVVMSGVGLQQEYIDPLVVKLDGSALGLVPNE